jgi:hypothetical protein
LVGFDEFVDERRGGGVESSVFFLSFFFFGIEREFFELWRSGGFKIGKELKDRK